MTGNWSKRWEGFARTFRLPNRLTQAPADTGWSYFWNAPLGWKSNQSPVAHASGAIGDSSSYLPLVPAEGGQWTADGDLDGLNSDPDFHLRLSDSGGQVGMGFKTPVYQDRFAIVAFTVQHSGLYAIYQTVSFRSTTTRTMVSSCIFMLVMGRG